MPSPPPSLQGLGHLSQLLQSPRASASSAVVQAASQLQSASKVEALALATTALARGLGQQLLHLTQVRGGAGSGGGGGGLMVRGCVFGHTWACVWSHLGTPGHAFGHTWSFLLYADASSSLPASPTHAFKSDTPPPPPPSPSPLPCPCPLCPRVGHKEGV